MQIYDKNAPGFDSVIEPSRVAKFENAGAGGGTGAPLTPAQQAAVDSGITAEKVAEYDETSTWVESKEKTGIIPPEPPPPTPTEEIIVDITQQVLDAGWVIGKNGDVTRGCAPVKYDNESYWNYDDFAFIKSSNIVELYPDGDTSYTHIETTFPAFRGSSNTPSFALVFLSELPEGYSDVANTNPGWPVDIGPTEPDPDRMNAYVMGYTYNSITAANPKTGEVQIKRIAIPPGAKYVKALWYTDGALAAGGLDYWNGDKPSINDFYMKKIKSGTIFDITDQFTSWRTGNVMAFTDGVNIGNYYVKNDTTIFDESDAVKIQDSDNEFQKLRVTIPQYTDSVGSRPKYAFAFLTELPDDYDEDDWYVADPSDPNAGPFYNQHWLLEQYSHWVDKAPTAATKHGAVEEVELVIPPNARYVKALWFTDTFTNWDGHGEVQFSCKKIKELDHPEVPKQVLTTEVYSDPMNNSETTLNDGHSSDKIEYRFVVVLPKNYSHTGKPSKVLMVCHGGTGEVRADGYWYPGDQADMYDTINMFRENGYVIFDVDKDNTSLNQCYGSPVMIEEYYNAFKWIQENYNVEDKLNIYAMSMGTNTAFNFVNLYRPLVKAVLITGPRTGVANDNFTNMNSNALANFGATSDDIQQKYYPFNILGQIINIPDGQNTIKSLTRNVPPTKIIALDSDRDSTQWTEGYDDVAEALYNAGNFVVVRTIDTSLSHAELCHLSAEVLRTEAIDWFNKYGK
jgi:hypothetical protein